jgi:hypothetical protein
MVPFQVVYCEEFVSQVLRYSQALDVFSAQSRSLACGAGASGGGGGGGGGLGEAAMESFQQWETETQESVVSALKRRRKIAVHITIDAPWIVLPLDCCDPDEAVLILHLGTFVFRSQVRYDTCI